MADQPKWPGGLALGAGLALCLVGLWLLPRSAPREGASPSPSVSAAAPSGPDSDPLAPSAAPRGPAGVISLGPPDGERATLQLLFFADADVRFRHHPVRVLLEGQGLPRGSGEAAGVTDAEGQVQITLPPGTYTLTPALGGALAERSLLFLGEGETSPLDWPRSGSGWGEAAPPSLPSLTLTLAAGEVTTRYAYDSSGDGPLTNALELSVRDAVGAPAAAVVEVYALDDARPRPNRGVIFYGAEQGPPPPPIAHPGQLRPRTAGLADTRGRISLRVSPGRRRVVARAGYRLGRLDLNLDELREAPYRAELTLSETIQRGGVLVRLSGAGGSAPPPGRYALRSREPAPYSRPEASGAAVALHDLPPGPTALVVERDGQRVGELSVEVVAGQTLERALTLR